MDRAFLSAVLDRQWYLRAYPDVASARIDPQKHFEQYGAAEARNPGPWFDGNWYLSENEDAQTASSPFAHFSEVGLAEGRPPHPAVSSHRLWREVVAADAPSRKSAFIRALPGITSYLDSGGFANHPHPVPMDGWPWTEVLKSWSVNTGRDRS